MSLDAGPRTQDTQLSTQPAAPQRVTFAGGPAAFFRRLWRQLTSMRTALGLLGLLALAAIPGSLLPQRANSPSRVQKYFADHTTLAPIFDRLSLFDTFHAPWFAAVYVLLFVSLVGCLVPRIRLHTKALRRRPPAAPARLGRLPQSATWQSAMPAEQVLAVARNTLRGKRFRTFADGDTVSAEKGYLRESGNLLFHVALVFLLVGIGIGSLFGYQGQLLLLQGQSFTNAQPLYDSFKPGALTGASDLSPFHVRLDEFAASYEPTGEAKTFDAHVTTASAHGTPRAVDLRVNHPLTYGNAKVYLIGHGYAIHAIIRDRAGQAVYDDTVPCIPQDLTNYLSSCVLKAPDTGGRAPASYTDPHSGETFTTNADGSPYTKPLQYGLLINFVPTAAVSPTQGILSTYPAPRRPRAVIGAFTGDLGLGNGQASSVYTLDTRGLSQLAIPVDKSVVTPGQGTRVPLSQGYTLDVAGYSEYATLQVKDDPAKFLTLIAAGLIVLGLLLSLRVRRRRLWLRATPTPAGPTLISVGGLARTDADNFAREFRALVRRLAGATSPADTAQFPDRAQPPDRPLHQEDTDAR